MEPNQESFSTRATPSSREETNEIPEQSQLASSNANRQGKRGTSMVWDHFEKYFDDDGVRKVKCIHCDRCFTAISKNGTSHLIDHLKVRCSKKNQKVDIRQKLLTVTKKADGSGITTLNASNFCQETSRRELANMVIIHEYPLAIVDHIGFRRFVSSLNPAFRLMSRNTLRSDIMRMFSSEKANLKKLLEKNKSRIAITTDMWTASNQKRGYMVVTAHYVDQFWVLHNKTLRFAYVPCPHTKDTLAQVLLETLNKFNITEKVVSVVVDNCSTNDAMLDILRIRLDEDSLVLKGKFLHMRCTAHILNLIVQDGLDIIGEGIDKVRECVAFWAATPKRIETYEDKVKSMRGEEPRKLSLDCKTRWNSTFLMLQSVLPYKEVFTNLKRLNPRLKFPLPTQEEWELATLVCGKLKKFHKMTKLFSGTKYPTSNLFFRQVCQIKLALTSWIENDIQVIRDMARKMMEKYDKYWMSINELLLELSCCIFGFWSYAAAVLELRCHCFRSGVDVVFGVKLLLFFWRQYVVISIAMPLL